jgi:hypothetical protein
MKFKKQPKEYKKQWRLIIKNKIDASIIKYKNKTIIFTGLLNNWGIDDEPFRIHVSCEKYFLDTPLTEILKRYYLRIYLEEQKASKKQSEWFWNCLAQRNCSISSSNQIIKNNTYDIKWHKSAGYKIMSIEKIKKTISKLII